MKITIALATALCMLLSSCYFNSAGHLFVKGGYKASADSSDAQVGKKVYTCNGDYYVELPRYRNGKKVLTQYAAWDKDKRQAGPQPTGDVTLFKIPADFAMYLIGNATSPTVPSFMTPVQDAAEIKQKSTAHTIVRRGGASTHNFDYSSPNAAWWYTAGVFEWLCVDLPITITENALAATLIAVMVVSSHNKSSSAATTSSTATTTSTTATTTSSADSTSTYSSSYSSSSDCGMCGGTGWVKSSTRSSNTIFLSRGGREECPQCKGTGSANVCTNCDGTGRVQAESAPAGAYTIMLRRKASSQTCPVCNGSGVW